MQSVVSFAEFGAATVGSFAVAFVMAKACLRGLFRMFR